MIVILQQYDADNFHSVEQLILDSMEHSMLHEYQQHIAPESLRKPLDEVMLLV